MNICFVCCRPFQLLNAINYIINNSKENKKCRIDLLLADSCTNVDLDKLKKYFENIYFFHERTKWSRLMKLKLFVFLKKEMNKDLKNVEIKKLKKYDIIFGTSYNSTLVRLCNCNRNAQIIFLEDGIGTYMNDDYLAHEKSKFSNLLKLFHRGVLSLKIKELYCYHPELVNIKKRFPYRQLPFLNESIINELKEVFNYIENEQYSQKQIVYFTSDKTWEEKYNFKEEFFYDELYKYKDNMILRFHPNNLKDEYREMDVDKINQLWEIQCKNVHERQVLIGIFSTAQFSPYLFYNKECYIILLYKLVFPPDSYLHKQCDAIVENLKKSIHRMYTPHTIEEYKEVVNNICNQ